MRGIGAALWAVGSMALAGCGAAGQSSRLSPGWSSTPETAPPAGTAVSPTDSSGSDVQGAPPPVPSPLATPAAVPPPLAMPPAVPPPLAPPPAAGAMNAVAPSAMAADLRALGLDPANLPPIEKLDPKALRGAMKLLARSLGAKCGDCHQEADFAAPTPRKRVAAKMWDEFVVKLAFNADDKALFCDSCHQGKMKSLDRSDAKALSAWMGANLVDPLKRKDGQEHGCETCHVNMDMRFLNAWAGGVL